MALLRIGRLVRPPTNDLMSEEKRATGCSEEIATLVQSLIAPIYYRMGSPYLIRLFAIVIGSHKKRIIKIDPKRAEQSVFKEERCFLCRADLARKG